jgi:hypothetical protein
LEKTGQTNLTRFWPWALGLGALLATAGAKFRLINFYGSDVPFGDQWKGEVLTTYLPYLEGRFDWHAWFTPHFEHRIVWTRLLDVGLLEANGRWDPRLQMVADAMVFLGAVAVLLRHVIRSLPPLAAAAAAGFVVLLFGSDVLWENTLWGFQSQFYFLLLFSLVHVLETSTARPWSTGWWLGHAAGFANLFAMAGGVFSAAAVLGWLAWRRWRGGERHPGDLWVAGWNLSLLALGFLLLPSDGLQPHGQAHPALSELLHRFCDVLSWPALDWKLGLLVWAPALLFLFGQVVAPKKQSMPAWLLPLVLLILVFCIAVTYARGGALASRYSDFYSVGAFANLVCLLGWPAIGRQLNLKLVLLLLWSFMIIHCLWRDEQYAHFYTLEKDVITRQREGERIRQYLRTGDEKLLQSDVAFDSDQIATFQVVRANPRVQSILPLSLQEPRAPVEADDHPGRGFAADWLPALPGLPAGFPARGSFGATDADARWTGTPQTARQPFLVFYVAGEIKPPLTALTLVAADGRIIAPLQSAVHAPDKWVRLNFSNPGQPFRIAARDADPAAAFAFSGPLELGPLSWLAPKMLGAWNVLLTIGWIVFASAVVVPLRRWVVAPAE